MAKYEQSKAKQEYEKKLEDEQEKYGKLIKESINFYHNIMLRMYWGWDNYYYIVKDYLYVDRVEIEKYSEEWECVYFFNEGVLR